MIGLFGLQCGYMNIFDDFDVFLVSVPQHLDFYKFLWSFVIYKKKPWSPSPICCKSISVYIYNYHNKQMFCQYQSSWALCHTDRYYRYVLVPLTNTLGYRYVLVPLTNTLDNRYVLVPLTNTLGYRYEPVKNSRFLQGT